VFLPDGFDQTCVVSVCACGERRLCPPLHLCPASLALARAPWVLQRVCSLAQLRGCVVWAAGTLSWTRPSRTASRTGASGALRLVGCSVRDPVAALHPTPPLPRHHRHPHPPPPYYRWLSRLSRLRCAFDRSAGAAPWRWSASTWWPTRTPSLPTWLACRHRPSRPLRELEADCGAVLPRKQFAVISARAQEAGLAATPPCVQAPWLPG
jgi:hypothetical protein